MTKPHRYLDGKTYCEDCKESVINSSIASTSPCRGQATSTVENPQPVSPDIERAYQWLLNSDDFDARNLCNTIQQSMVQGADCFDVRGAAKILVKYAASCISAAVGRQPELVSSLEEVLRALKKSFRGDSVRCADEMISRAELLLNQIATNPAALPVGRRQEHPDSWWWEIINGAIGQWGGPQYKYFNEAIARIKDVYDKRVAGLDEWGEPLEEAGLPARESGKPLLLCETCGKPKLKHDMSVASGMITSGYFCGCPIVLEQVEPTLTYERLPKITVSHGAPPGVGPGPAVEGESHVPPTHNHSVDTFPQHITKEGVGVWRKDCPACEPLGVKSVEVASGKGNYYLPADDEAFRLVVWAMEERPGKTAQDNLAEAISAAIKLGEKRANERKKHEG